MVTTGVTLPSFPELVVKAKYATEHRCGIVVSGVGLSDEVSGTDPLKDNLPLQVSSKLHVNITRDDPVQYTVHGYLHALIVLCSRTT